MLAVGYLTDGLWVDCLGVLYVLISFFCGLLCGFMLFLCMVFGSLGVYFCLGLFGLGLIYDL